MNDSGYRNEASRVLAWTAAGGAGGLVFSGLEGAYVMWTGEHVPPGLPLLSALPVALCAALAGGVARSTSSLWEGHRGGQTAERLRISAGLWCLATWFLFLSSLPELKPLWDKGSAIGGLVTAAASAGAAVVFSWPSGRLFHTPVGPARCVLASLGPVTLFLLADLNSRLLPSALGPRSLAVDVAVATAGATVILLLDRTIARLEHWAPGRIGQMGFLLPVFMAWAIWGAIAWLERPLDLEAFDPTDGQAPAYHSQKHEPGRNQERISRPDVILLILDTTRFDVLTPYGADAELTPALASLAEESVVYVSAIAPTSWTLPSIATLFTGLYPAQHGADRTHPLPSGVPSHALGRPGNGSHTQAEASSGAGDVAALPEDEVVETLPLAPGVPTLAQLLRETGYQTAAVLANSGFLHPYFGLDRGFDHYNARSRLVLRRSPLALPLLRRYHPDFVSRLTRWCRSAEDIFSEAVQWLEARNDAPVFLAINLMEAHDPYVPPPPFDRRKGRVPGLRDPYFEVIRGDRAINERERAHLRASYEGAVQYMDREIGRFLESLHEMGRWDNTLLIVVSDHGEMFGRHGMLRHGMEVWETLVRVPLIVRFPGGRDAGRVLERVHLVDVAPTVLAETRVENPGLPGVPLSGASPGGADSRSDSERAGPARASRQRPLLTEVLPSHHGIALVGERWNQALACVYQGHYKYCEGSRGGRRLFNVRLDVGEARNLVDTEAVRAAEMASLLSQSRLEIARRWKDERGLGTEGEGAGGIPAEGASRPSAETSAEALEQLKALGYVQ